MDREIITKLVTELTQECSFLQLYKCDLEHVLLSDFNCTKYPLLINFSEEIEISLLKSGDKTLFEKVLTEKSLKILQKTMDREIEITYELNLGINMSNIKGLLRDFGGIIEHLKTEKDRLTKTNESLIQIIKLPKVRKKFIFSIIPIVLSIILLCIIIFNNPLTPQVNSLVMMFDKILSSYGKILLTGISLTPLLSYPLFLLQPNFLSLNIKQNFQELRELCKNIKNP